MRLVSVVTSTRSPTADPLVHLREQVVDLRARRAHDHLRVDEPGGAHHLLDHLRGVLRLVVGRRRGDEDGLAHLALELLELERAVVERRGQAEAVGHQRLLARAVAVVHAAHLRDGDVALVDDEERVRRQVVDERGRRLARGAAREVARVVLDALAEAQLVQHLEVEVGALLQPLQLQELALLLEEVEPLAQLRLDGLDRPEHRLARRHVVALRVHREARDASARGAR